MRFSRSQTPSIIMTTVSLGTHHHLSHYWSPCSLLLKETHTCSHMYVQDRYYVFSSLTVPGPHSGQATGRGKCLVALTSAGRSFTVGIPDIRCFLRSLMFIFSWALLHTLTIWWGLCNRFWLELLRCQKCEVETGWAIPFVLLGSRTVEPFSTHNSINFQRPFAKRKKASNPLITASGNSWHQITTNEKPCKT